MVNALVPWWYEKLCAKSKLNKTNHWYIWLPSENIPTIVSLLHVFAILPASNIDIQVSVDMKAVFTHLVKEMIAL